MGLAATDSNDHLIKRVIGLPGDHVECCNALGQMMVNGVPLNEPYLKLPDGITKVSDWADFEAALAAARQVDPKVLVEAAVVGREIECGVLEGEHGGPPEASVCAEIHVPNGYEFYDFAAKYLDDVCEFDIPAQLPAHVTERIRELACRTFTALDCAGLARVDFFVTGDFEVYLNEINTMPGFTKMSMFPRMWAATGLEYPKLISRLIRTALRRGTGLH